jgi:U3 small nucleolar RNA-associated protein 3
MRRATLNQVEVGDGPRSVSYAILRNKGLTPKRNKLNRNPRVKKRHKYEGAKKKIGSMKAVYKADAAQQGRQAYEGEKSGVSRKVVKSRKLSG